MEDFQFVKGWPSAGAIDEVVETDVLTNFNVGTVGMIDATGKGAVGEYADDGSNAQLIPFICLDTDKTRSTVTGLFGKCMVECSANYLKADTYAAGDKLTAKGGKFEKVTGANTNLVVGTIRNVAIGGNSYRILCL